METLNEQISRWTEEKLGHASDEYDVAAYRAALAREWPFGQDQVSDEVKAEIAQDLLEGRSVKDVNGMDWVQAAEVARTAALGSKATRNGVEDAQTFANENPEEVAAALEPGQFGADEGLISAMGVEAVAEIFGVEHGGDEWTTACAEYNAAYDSELRRIAEEEEEEEEESNDDTDEDVDGEPDRLNETLKAAAEALNERYISAGNVVVGDTVHGRQVAAVKAIPTNFRGNASVRLTYTDSKSSVYSRGARLLVVNAARPGGHHTMKAATKYVRVDPSAVPPGLRWDVPQRNQGQTVEVAYACPGSRAAADEGDEWQRVTDRGVGTVKYYRREARELLSDRAARKWNPSGV